MTELVAEFRSATAGRSVPQVRKATAAFWRGHRSRPAEVFVALRAAWADGDHSVRLAVAMTCGPVAAAGVRPAATFMTGTIAGDADWRVQESLAKGFDWMCAEQGWKESRPVIEEWLGHRTANVRRAAAEGPRVWTKRPYFAEHPQEAVRLLGALRADSSEYVRKSVAHALSDISKTHPDLILAALSGWAGEDDAAWVVEHAARHLRTAAPDHPLRTVQR